MWIIALFLAGVTYCFRNEISLALEHYYTTCLEQVRYEVARLFAELYFAYRNYLEPVVETKITLSETGSFCQLPVLAGGREVESIYLPIVSGLRNYDVSAYYLRDAKLTRVPLVKYLDYYLGLQLSPADLGVSSLRLKITARLTGLEIEREISGARTLAEEVKTVLATLKELRRSYKYTSSKSQSAPVEAELETEADEQN